MRRLPFDLPGSWIRGNLHAHSTDSDGTLTAIELGQRYRDAGYQFLAITDHLEGDRLALSPSSLPRVDGLTMIRGAELHPGNIELGGPWHIVAVGLPPSFAAATPSESPQDLVRRASRAGAFVTLAHPYWYGLTAREAAAVSGAHAVEVWNGTADGLNDKADSWHLLDRLASEGSRILAVAVDDAHVVADRADLFRGWVWVRSVQLDVESIVAALKSGHFYSSTGPRIHDVRVAPGDRAVVDCDPVDAIFFTGRGWLSQASLGSGLTRAEFSLKDFPSPFGRVTIRDRMGGRAWTNTIWW